MTKHPCEAASARHTVSAQVPTVYPAGYFSLSYACRARPGVFVVNPDGSTYNYFNTTLDPVAQTLFKKPPSGAPYVSLLNDTEGAGAI